MLIKPEPLTEQTESGLHIVQGYQPEQRGTVVAMGRPVCTTCGKKRPPSFKVGDDVLFSWMVGQEVWLEDGQERYLLMRQDDVLAVVEDA